MDMTKIRYRWMKPIEVLKIGEIDRSEQIRTGYHYIDGKLQQMSVNWDSPTWAAEGNGEYTVAAQIKYCQGHLERNGQMYGAFDDEILVGIGIVQQDIGVGTAQLAFLHVSNQYRQKRIGGKIADVLIAEAKKAGADKMYVSAAPTGSAVGFYLSRGFKPTDSPIPELFELEPEDIHMVKIFEK
ncbi:MAG: GNAT family N-acetyltransferase [Chloroflexi bacterium]|nr:GNAT family N-acetyltransferase [Chloroflexota bacterium]